jgi:hypothetical protein
MAASIDTLRTLAAQNAALSAQAQTAQQSLLEAADKECARLNTLITNTNTKPVDVLTDDAKAAQYQSWVMQRAQLLELLASHSA